MDAAIEIYSGRDVRRVFAGTRCDEVRRVAFSARRPSAGKVIFSSSRRTGAARLGVRRRRFDFNDAFIVCPALAPDETELLQSFEQWRKRVGVEQRVR